MAAASSTGTSSSDDSSSSCRCFEVNPSTSDGSVEMPSSKRRVTQWYSP